MKIEMIILKKCNPVIILGDDFLSQNKALINCQNNTLWVESPNIFDQNESNLRYAHIAEDKIIPEYCLCLVKGYSMTSITGREILIENIPSLTTKYNLITTRSLLNNTKKYLTIWILNSTNKPVKLFRNTKIGILSEVDRLYQTGNQRVASIRADFDINPGLCPEERSQVLTLLSGYGEMFTAPDEYKGRTHLVKHQIKTTSDIPIRKNPYRVSLKERNIISDQINSMLKNGIISHSSSPWASPIILVKKKNGTFRFCVDYRNLNSVTVKDQYPLPRIDDCFDSLHGARYFTSLDLCSGYWQVEVEEQDREKTAFITPDGLYQFNVLPFGLCNGPATFERLMDTVLRTHKWKICLCYLDDVIIFSEDLHSHLNRLKTILECLKTAGLTLNASKCRFAYTELLILGHVVSNEGIAPDPEKIISIRKFPTPRTVKDVRAFLGLCSYYRRFIREFSKVALPLQILTRKNHSFAWGKEQELSFNSLKNKLISPEVLTHYDPNKPIGLHTDASDQGLGAVLVHLNENTKERPISYASRTLQKAETNYSTTEKECLAIIWAIKKFRPYLYGRKFTIYTDHHSLCWMAKMKNPAGRLARWSLELQEYDFAIKYKSGKTHLDADGLSRCPIPERIISTINYEEHDYDSYIKKIDNLVNQNPNSYGENFTKFKEKLFKKNPSVTGDPWLLIVPKNKQKELLENMHDHPTSGHMGIKRTYNRLKSKYFWPSMLKTVEEYVSSCPECQFRKTPSQLPQGLLQPIPPASRPFEKMGIDLMGRFPKSGRGNSWILVCTDYYSRYIETAALTRGTAEEIADFFLQKVVLRHGAPKTVISDRGSCFLSKLFKEVLKICNTLHKKTTSYHPQTNGQTERMNRTLADMMAMYIDERHQNWDEILPFVTFAYNSSIQDTTGYSPYFLIHGREPLTFLDSTFDMPEFSKHKDYDEYVSNLLEIIEDAKEISTSKTIARQNKSKKLYDKTHREVKYAINDLVLIWTPIRKVGRADKLQRRYIGPYQILRQTSPVNYEVIETAEGKRKKRQIVHVTRMKPYRSPDLRTSLFQEGETSTGGDSRDADRRTAIQRPAPSPRSASREPRRVVPTGTADPRAQCTDNATQRRSTTHNVGSVSQHTPTPKCMECTSSAVQLQVLRREALAQRMPTSSSPEPQANQLKPRRPSRAALSRLSSPTYHTKSTHDHTSPRHNHANVPHNIHARQKTTTTNKRNTRANRRQRQTSACTTVKNNTIIPSTQNIEKIHATKQPHNRKTLRSFLKAVNAYKEFIPDHARLRTPLVNLLKKDVMWVWSDECQKAFTNPKESLTTHPTLYLYQEGLPCQVHCNTSTFGIAGILKQVYPDGKTYPVQHFSRSLRGHERNYSDLELQCLAIVESVDNFRACLMGRKFTILSDHPALQWLKEIKAPSGRLFRWRLRLSRYEYEVRSINGVQQYETGVVTRIPFCGFLDAPLIKSQQSSPPGKSRVTMDHNKLRTVSRKGVLKTIVPSSLTTKLLKSVHTQHHHPNISKMTRLISSQYYWQNMTQDIAKQ
ncbi:K02A2.6-like, partial [Cordylochernes scorpioides]